MHADAVGQFKQAAMRRSNRNFNIPPSPLPGQTQGIWLFYVHEGWEFDL